MTDPDTDAQASSARSTHAPESPAASERTTGGLFETATDQDAVARAVAAAAPVAAERADVALVGSLEPALREPVFGLLSTLADNKYLLGRRYAEWCTGAPMLESAVAAAAMAQDELGHARSFYPLLRAFPNGRDLSPMEEKGWQQRATSAMRVLGERFDTWADFLAVNIVVDTALTTLLESAVDSPYEPLRQRARKIQQEEAAHWVHGLGWLRRLPPTDLAPALARVWDDAFTWFGQPDDPVVAPLHRAGLLAADSQALRQALGERLAPPLRAAGLLEALAQRPLPWSSWDPAARRLRA
ncbi:MAG TPA: Phenylacetic acid catabolic protein [Chloroflexota bacterium]|nr:Phenylacetic acid catabolic protein [Chloroflexota bacterium]